MHNIIFYPIAAGLGLLISAATASAVDVNCTKAPDCATLGYNKTATDCPKGGVKCPFDSNKMFCLKNTAAYDFQITQAVKLYDVVYHDGTTSTSTSVSGKTPIGIVYYVQPDGKNLHGLIMSLEQPMVGTRQEAIDYCAGYVTKGTNVGDWRLPNVTEMLRMGNEYSQGNLNTKYWDLQQKLALIYNAEPLKHGNRTFYYWRPNNKYSPKYFGNINNSSNLIGYGLFSTMVGGEYNSGSANDTLTDGCSTVPAYWTISDYPTGSNNAYYVMIVNEANNYIKNDNKNKNGHFRCILQFQKGVYR